MDMESSSTTSIRDNASKPNENLTLVEQPHSLPDSVVSTSILDDISESNNIISLTALLTQLEQDGYGTIPVSHVLPAAFLFIDKFNIERDINTLDRFCRYLDWSMDQSKPEVNYIANGFKQEHVMIWIQHVKMIAVHCLNSMSKLKPELQTDSKSMSVFMSAIVVLTSMKGLKFTKLEEYKAVEMGIGKMGNTISSYLVQEGNYYENLNKILLAGYSRPGKITFTKTKLCALSTLAFRPIMDPTLVKETLTLECIVKVLSVPAYVHYVYSLSPEIGLPKTLFPVLVDFLATNLASETNKVLKEKDICFTLALLANLTDLGQHYSDLIGILHPKFMRVLLHLLQHISNGLSISKKSHWHPILGWVSAPISVQHLNTVDAVRCQLETLWKPIYVQACFHPLFQHLESLKMTTPNESDKTITQQPSVSKASSWKTGIIKLFKRVIPGDPRKRTSIPSNGLAISSEITSTIALGCSLYNSIISSLQTSKIDLLTGLCFKNSSKLIVSLWKFLECLSSEQHVKGWVDVLTTPMHEQEDLILLFAESLMHFITVLDDQEFYDERKIFNLETLADISLFINSLCYRLLCHSQFSRVKPGTWSALKNLLMVLYRRDSRRQFCTDGVWLIESSKMTALVNDIDKGRTAAKKVLLEMPHVIKEESRVIMFRKWATSEKSRCSFGSSAEDMLNQMVNSGRASPGIQLPSSLITVHRSRIVEDGYAQLSSLSLKRFKGTIRVRFQNEHGLDEAGIDQDGVFKEFLEETITKVFSPSLNLFKATSENLLYPSPLSYLHENHLDLFEFVGKMLGKAVFEGIVVDVHFAPFFVSQMLGLQQNGLLYSVIDELQSLDRELYNSLIYIKHYQGDVKDLELTFSIDQDVLGVLQNVELIPGGRTIPVTNENKINYIYLKAHFHLYAQIKEQTSAFLRGFRYIIPTDWLRIFSPPELQRLISGEDSDIDLVDLRRNTQYYGGFHDSHRVIVWLWEILENDFNESERRLFLKFVTSCSKPPLLGFTNLDPAFSVRCVEVSDDDDTGDTIGSVLRGFLTLGKQEPIGRLPTSSTCFNLLKLPNYHKKATLRDKLRYAITSNVGFELS